MKNPHDIILRPVLTEKSYDQIADRKYTFIVDKKAVEEIFGVKVENVRTIRQKGKLKRQGMYVGRTPERKKAVVKLTADSKPIEFFEGMA